METKAAAFSFKGTSRQFEKYLAALRYVYSPDYRVVAETRDNVTIQKLNRRIKNG